MKMSEKIQSFAKKWKDVIYITIFILSGLGLVYSSGRWTASQEMTNQDREHRICLLERSKAQTDSLVASLSNNQKQSAMILSSIIDRWNEFEPEHIELLKRHGIYSKKMYRGEIK